MKNQKIILGITLVGMIVIGVVYFRVSSTGSVDYKKSELSSNITSQITQVLKEKYPAYDFTFTDEMPKDENTPNIAHYLFFGLNNKPEDKGIDVVVSVDKTSGSIIETQEVYLGGD